MEAWQQKAYDLGWSDAEIAELMTLLNTGHRDTQVEEVTTWAINLRSSTEFVFHGVGVDGTPRPRTTLFVRSWTWRRHAMPCITVSAIEHQTDWCPIHGNNCARTARGCVRNGEPPLIQLELAAFEINPAKTIRSRIRPDLLGPPKAEIAVVPAVIPQLPAFLEPPAPPKTARKKGSPLPGQMALGLPAPKR